MATATRDINICSKHYTECTELKEKTLDHKIPGTLSFWREVNKDVGLYRAIHYAG